MLTKRREMIEERKEKGDGLGTKRKKYIDFTLRNYIKNRLESLKDLPDAIDALPEGQTKKIFDQIDDNAVFTLLRSAIEIMRAKRFRPVVGEIEDPDKWETIHPRPGDANTDLFDKVTDIDIRRSREMAPLLTDLLELVDINDPVVKTVRFQNAKRDPSVQDILKTNPGFSEKYKPAEKRISEASLAIDSRKWF